MSSFITWSSDKAEAINVVSWGYLTDGTLIPEIEDHCSVLISVDSYTSNQEFLNRIKTNPVSYDIAIFSETIYQEAKEFISTEEIDLTEASKRYNPAIKEHYQTFGYPKNVVFYLHSLSGFLWNENNINISESDTIESIFDKSAGKDVVIMDDPVEAWNLMNVERNTGEPVWTPIKTNQVEPLTNENFNNFIKTSKVYISNTYNRVYESQNFAFSFIWSGVAAYTMKALNSIKFKFLVHPKLSYISTDLLAALNKKDSTICVSKMFLEKEMLKKVIQNEFYLDPSLDISLNQDPLYQKLYSDIPERVHQLKWLKSLPIEDYKRLTKQWASIKRSSLN